MVNLIKPKQSGDSSTTEFYTVESTGESGMSQSGLSVLCGVTQPAISALEKTLISRAPSKTLEPFVGKRLILISSDEETITINGVPAGNLKIYTAAFCAAVIRHRFLFGLELSQERIGKPALQTRN